MAAQVKPGGSLILVEGYRDGFDALNDLRARVNLPPVEPAQINFYSRLDEILPMLHEHFDITHEYHLGNYDYLTRVVYPQLVGPENVTHNTEMHDRLAALRGSTIPMSSSLCREFVDLCCASGKVKARYIGNLRCGAPMPRIVYNARKAIYHEAVRNRPGKWTILERALRQRPGASSR